MRTGEVIVASIIGERPFSDSILTVSSEGHVKTVLSASARESYPGVHALSMQQPFVVVVNELAGDRVRRSLKSYDPIARKFSPSCWELSVNQPIGMVSPDYATYAFPNPPSRFPQVTFIRCDKPPAMPSISQFTDGDAEGEQSWYISLSWFPDNIRLAAVRVWRSREFKGLRTELQLIDTKSKTRRVLLGNHEVVVACAVARDGRVAVLDLAGVEIILPDTGRRRTVLPVERLNKRRYLSSGMAWLNQSDTIVLGLVAPTEMTGELWRISADDGSTAVLHREKGFRFGSICSTSD